MSGEDDSKTGEEISRNVAKNVNKILEVYLKQVFGPMVRDIKHINEKLTTLEAEIANLNQMISEKGIGGSPNASHIEKMIQKTVETKIAEKSAAVEDLSREKEIAAASSKKEYIYSEMSKCADYFEAKGLPESQLYEKKEIKDKIKEAVTFLNKEASSAGTSAAAIDIIQNLIKLMKDLEYKLNSSLQARFYKDDFIDFIGDVAAKEIRKLVKDLV